MNLSLKRIAGLVGGEVRGNDRVKISGVAPFESASAGDITFAESLKRLKKITDTAAGAVVVPKDFEYEGKPLLRVENPKVAFAKLVEVFHPRKKPAPGIDPGAVIGKNFSCGKDVSVAPGTVIADYVSLGNRVILHPHVFIGEHVTIGDDTEIFPNVTILERCAIGNRVIVHSGTVIGSDGFGFAPDGEAFRKIPQIGIVQIDDDVEIGACNTIDRAAFGKTWLQKGVKTDNLIQIAHNVTVGENSILVAQAGISGSVTVGKNVIIAGQAGISGHLTIGDHAVIGPQTGVIAPVPSGAVVSGSPERPHTEHRRIQRTFSHLPEMKKRLDTLEKQVAVLLEKYNSTER